MFSLVPATQMGRNEKNLSTSQSKNSGPSSTSRNSPSNRVHSPNSRYRTEHNNSKSNQQQQHQQSQHVQSPPNIHRLHQSSNKNSTSTAIKNQQSSTNKNSLPKQQSIYAGEDNYPPEPPGYRQQFYFFQKLIFSVKSTFF